MNFLTGLTTLILLFFFPGTVYAYAFVSEFCNVNNIVNGTAGKIIAAVGVIGVGVGFFNGKASWGLLVGTCVGVGLMHGAPTMVSAISGKATFECIADQTYVTTCANGECYSCPAGYGGSDCSSCGVGFTGSDCDECATGYEDGENGSCTACNPGYTRYEGACHPDCTGISVVGYNATSVSGGVSQANCDANNFTGTFSYSCLNGTFSETSNNCSCSGNYSGSNCGSCVDGYTTESLCTDCESAHTKVGVVCYPDCTSSSITGLELSSSNPAIPPNGEISCNVSGYSGNISYSCLNGQISSTSGSCVYNQCSGGSETTISVGGTLYKLHVFTSGGSFFCPVSKNVEYLVVAGGGGGGTRHGGGGGAGGMLEGSRSISANSSLLISVGSGGSQNITGSNSSIGSLVIARGGGKGSSNGATSSSLAGGSGGGASNAGNGGSATSGQGNNGGNNPSTCCQGIGSGGGGAGSAGGNASVTPGNGGAGKTSSITGESIFYAGGGGGGSWFQSANAGLARYANKSFGTGGSSVGGNGGDVNNMSGGNGLQNTGSGGGGGGADGSLNGTGGSGGSGIVIIRYPK